MQKARPAPLALKTKLPVPSQQPSPTAPFKKHLHSRSAATTSTRIPQSPRPRSMPVKPKAKNGGDYSQEAQGLLTPSSTAPESPRHTSPRNFPSSPLAPKKEDQATKVPAFVAQLHLPPSPAKSPYMHAQVGDPCIRGALVHQLSCSHKVLTHIPEQCKTNCQRPLPEMVDKYANVKDNENALVCTVCVERHVELQREAKRTAFKQSIQKTGVPAEWAESQMEYWERVWDNDVEKEKAEFAKLGENCEYIPGKPIPIDPAQDKVTTESSMLPLPMSSKKKTQELRTPSPASKFAKDSK